MVFYHIQNQQPRLEQIFLVKTTIRYRKIFKKFKIKKKPWLAKRLNLTYPKLKYFDFQIEYKTFIKRYRYNINEIF